MFFKLTNYDDEYYRIYHRRRRVGLESIPSFRWIKHQLALETDDILLDAGCGNGAMLDFLCHGTGVRGVGLDISQAAIDIAKKNVTAFEYSRGDLASLMFSDNSFDKIICFNVIEHIADQDWAIRELRRVLKPGGTLIMGTNIRDSFCWWLYQRIIEEHTHTREFSVPEFIDFVGQYFQVELWTKSSGVFRPPAVIRWVFHKILLGDILVRATQSYDTTK